MATDDKIYLSVLGSLIDNSGKGGMTQFDSILETSYRDSLCAQIFHTLIPLIPEGFWVPNLR